MKCHEEKPYHYQIYHCLKVKPSFHEKLFQKEKKIVMGLCPATFRSFVLQWSTKLAGRPPQLKALLQWILLHGAAVLPVFFNEKTIYKNPETLKLHN